MKYDEDINEAYWKGVPDELRNLILAEMRRGHSYYDGKILQYLLDHTPDDESEPFVTGVKPEDYIRWTDIAMESCFVPVEFKEESWEKYTIAIRRVLRRSERLLQGLEQGDNEDDWNAKDESGRFNIHLYKQKLAVYWAIMYSFNIDEWYNLQTKMKEVFDYTRQNVEHLFVLGESSEIYDAVTNDALEGEFHYPGTDELEPITWLYRELSRGLAGRLLTGIYEQYVNFLYKLMEDEPAGPRFEAFLPMYKKAEERLENLLLRILDEIEDEISDDNLYLKEMEKYEHSLEESDKRWQAVKALRNKRDQRNTDNGSSRTFHLQWGGFTRKLKKLLDEYESSIPVVVLLPELADKELECNVCYIHDSDGQFREKIIGIYLSNENHDKDSFPFDDDTELPFH